MNSIVGKVTDEDLARWRMSQAKLEGIAAKPDGYTREEVEQAWVAKYRLCGEFVERYGMDDSKKWNVSLYSGEIAVSLEEYDL